MFHQFDVQLSKKIQEVLSGRRGPAYSDTWHQRFWELSSSHGAMIYAVIMLGLLLLLQDHRVFLWLIPVVAASVATMVLQAIIQRPRPKETRTTYKPIIPTFSFPSNHATSSFAFATSLSYAFLASSLSTAWLFVVLFYLLAIVISLSRVVVGVHYALDVFAGALFGIFMTVFLFGI